MVRRLVDLLAVVVVVGVFWLPATLEARSAARLTAGLVLAAAVACAMLVRRRVPTTAVLVAGTATVVATALGTCQDFMVATAWCLYPLALRSAARTRRLIRVLVVALLATAAIAGIPPGQGSQVVQSTILSVAALCVAWLLGGMVGRQIELARQAESARVRLEVARDVHDVVGHALGLVSAEAGVVRSLPDADERELRESLADIEVHARRALEEMQSLVRGLRGLPGLPGPHGGSTGPLRPAGPPAERLTELVDATRATGVAIDARIDLDAPVGEEVAAFVVRVLQESLANVVRHAPGAACTVVVEPDGDDVVVRVRDDGTGSGGRPGAGVGLRGMRERARLVGGAVAWGRAPDGGFEVTARAPRAAPWQGLSTFG
ncbi:histidine kinase [Xylanimonas cellulosilytica DSM 15894]|uniref:histidine kinase n=2 Tax=Xylanimonas TaxID=186188 RepID=D1BTX2_XYLCX|nr:histidine kinase [Xylanimonas cellulosilytica DSM 15894]